jgi:WD40 repeat protein/energy-coupling factor transporter ATP-binding protein EcfA2/flagellar biosynthesis GTPase FlhF
MQEINRHANPFPGLRPFESTETHLFFGRDGQSEELLRRLKRTRFLAVVGTSGSGKSSLVRAGLLPALQGGLMASAGSDWRIAILRPGDDPIGNLANALASPAVLGAPDEEDEDMQAVLAETTLRRSSLGLVELVGRARAKLDADGEPLVHDYENLLVVVDQFEEIFRFKQLIEKGSMQEDAAAFVKLLLEAVRQKEEKIYVVLTMRSDFLGDCAQFRDLPEAINDGQYLIPRMTRDERRAAITGPAAVGEGAISEPLVNQLLNDVGDNPDQLPIMQHALMRTWDYWRGHRRNGDPIDIPDYEAIGGMSEALSRHADEAFGELSDAQKVIAEKLFKGLTEKGADNREIRRPMEVGEICELTGAGEAEVIAVVEVFRREGRSFLMPPPLDPLTHASIPLNRESLIDISHESLIRNWSRLRRWVDEEAQSARIYKRLAETAVLHKVGEEALLKDPALEVALDWRDRNRPNAAWGRRYHPEFDTAMSFLDTSVAAREAELKELEKQRRRNVSYKRTRLAALFLALSFLLSVGATAYAYKSMSLARASEARAMNSEAAAVKALSQAVKEREEATQARRDAETQADYAQAAQAQATDQLQKAEAAKADADRRAEVASESEARASVALRSANVARHEAEAQSARNADETKQVRQILYPVIINRAQQAYESSDIEYAREALSLQQTAIRDTPGFEWFYLWHLLSGEKETVNVKEDYVSFVPVAVSGDGKLLAVGSNMLVKVSGIGGGPREPFPVTINVEGFGADSLAFSPDGTRLAVGNAGFAGGPAVKLFDVVTREEVKSLGAIGLSNHGTRLVSFTPDGKRLVIGEDSGVWLWDFATAGEPAPLVPNAREFVWFVGAVSPDGRLLAVSTTQRLILLDAATRRQTGKPLLQGEQHHVACIAFSRDGRRMAAGDDRSGVVTVWDTSVPVPKMVTELKDDNQGLVLEVAFSNDAKHIAARDSGLVWLWDVAEAKLIKSLGYSEGGSPASIAFSPVRRELAIGLGNGKILLCDEDTLKPLVTLRGHKGSVTSLAYTSDGSRIASGDEAGIVKLRDAATLREMLTLDLKNSVQSIAFSPDGRTLTTLDTSLKVRFWRAATDAEVAAKAKAEGK